MFFLSYIANGNTFKMEYGSGPVSGFFSQDNVNIGGGSIKDYTFADWECSTLSENSTESAVWLEFHFRGRSSCACVRSGGCW